MSGAERAGSSVSEKEGKQEKIDTETDGGKDIVRLIEAEANRDRQRQGEKERRIQRGI